MRRLRRVASQMRDKKGSEREDYHREIFDALMHAIMGLLDYADMMPVRGKPN